MICDVVAISGDPKQLQWCAILETGSETLDAMIRKRGQLDKGEVRQAFIRVARGVQALHRAGLVHNAVCAQNVIRVSSGVKLGNYAALQRQSEKQRQGGPGHTLCSPERALAESSHTTLTCDFANHRLRHRHHLSGNVECVKVIITQQLQLGIPLRCQRRPLQIKMIVSLSPAASQPPVLAGVLLCDVWLSDILSQ